MEKIKDILFRSGYGGGAKIEVRIGEEWHILENSEAEKIIIERLEKGYEIRKTKQQKHNRIFAI